MKNYFIELKNIFKSAFQYIKENLFLIPVLSLFAFPIFVLAFAFSNCTYAYDYDNNTNTFRWNWQEMNYINGNSKINCDLQINLIDDDFYFNGINIQLLNNNCLIYIDLLSLDLSTLTFSIDDDILYFRSGL